MLNSMLILGGLLGTMARNEKRLGSPFKRADGSLAKFKKRWLPKKFSKGGGSKVVEVGATTTEMPVVSLPPSPLPSPPLEHHHHLYHPQHPQLLQSALPQRGSPLPPPPPPIVEHQYYYPQEQGPPLQGPPPPQSFPYHPNHLQQHPQQNLPPHHQSIPQEQMFHQPPPAALMDAIDPRSASAILNSITTANNNLPLILRRNDQQLPREHRSLSTSSPSSPSSPPSSTSSCGHVLRCLDPSGARLKEAHSPSELSQLALR